MKHYLNPLEGVQEADLERSPSKHAGKASVSSAAKQHNEIPVAAPDRAGGGSRTIRASAKGGVEGKASLLFQASVLRIASAGIFAQPYLRWEDQLGP